MTFSFPLALLSSCLSHAYVGDTIVSVNQHNVNMDNIDSVLATLSSKIHFLIKKGHSNHSSPALLSPPPPPSPHVGSSGGLVRLVTGGRGTARLGPIKQQRHLHMLLYITLDTREDDPPEKVPVVCMSFGDEVVRYILCVQNTQDILFQYPRLSEEEWGGARDLEQLLRLRGVFLTLSDALGTVTGSLSVCK